MPLSHYDADGFCFVERAVIYVGAYASVSSPQTAPPSSASGHQCAFARLIPGPTRRSADRSILPLDRFPNRGDAGADASSSVAWATINPVSSPECGRARSRASRDRGRSAFSQEAHSSQKHRRSVPRDSRRMRRNAFRRVVRVIHFRMPDRGSVVSVLLQIGKEYPVDGEMRLIYRSGGGRRCDGR